MSGGKPKRFSALRFVKILKLLKNNAVLCVAIVAAVITAFIVPPDEKYLGYFDLSTLYCLFGTLAVVEGLARIGFFEFLARKIVVKFKNLRAVTFALVFITYFGSMVMANDMALITFLPLGYYALESTGRKDKNAFVFVMQNVAANLGGMLTPFGNPQNLYLYSYYKIPTGEFFYIMLAPFIAAFLLIFVCCFFVKPDPVTLETERENKPDAFRSVAYLVLFAVAVASVMRLFPYYVGVSIAVAGVLILDFKSFAKVNYGLLLTFCAFFVFSGNMSRIDGVNRLIDNLLNKNPLLVSILSCQVISNVPSATLLCKFTTNYAPLLRGVNVGGLGTPISSLASLITISEYKKRDGDFKKYALVYTAVNLSYLAVLIVVCLIFR